jgi:hypothetical protein
MALPARIVRVRHNRRLAGGIRFRARRIAAGQDQLPPQLSRRDALLRLQIRRQLLPVEDMGMEVIHRLLLLPTRINRHTLGLLSYPSQTPLRASMEDVDMATILVRRRLRAKPLPRTP